MHFRFLCLLLLLTPSLSFAQSTSKKQDAVPKAFFVARFAYVQALDGDVFDLRLLDDDRKAIMDVTNALRDWNRYIITPKRHGADFLFVVRKGRIVDAQASAGGGGGPYPHTTAGLGAEVGSSDDLLYVYLVNSDDSIQGPIWKRFMKDGLDTPDIPLFKQLKDEVEAAAKQQPHHK